MTLTLETPNRDNGNRLKKKDADTFSPVPSTLKLNKEFRHAYYQGKSRATPFFICYAARGHAGSIRYGITTSKKVGGAVQRNRARRLLRAAFRDSVPYAKIGRDYVFVARAKILSAKSYQVASVMKKCLQQLSGQESGSKLKPHKLQDASHGCPSVQNTNGTLTAETVNPTVKG